MSLVMARTSETETGKEMPKKMTKQEEQQPQLLNSDCIGSSLIPKMKDEVGVDRREE